MYVLSNYTFTPNVSNGYDQLVVPGVYGIERFVSIENATQNDVLYSATGAHLGSITVSDNGLETTVLIYTAATEKNAQATDKIRILIYDPTPTGSGPSSNVAVTNWPISQNVNGAVTVSGEVEVKNDTGSPLSVSGTVSVGNFPATQPVSGSVSVSNFPATQTVDGSVTISNDSGSPVPVTFPSGVSVSNFPATQTVNGSVSVSNFPTSTTVSGTVDVGNFPASQTVDGAVTVSGTVDVGNFPTSFDVGNFPATQTVDGSVSVSNFPASTTVSGSVDVNNFPATQTVDGSVSVSNFPATQPVSGSVTVNGTVDIGNYPATQTVDGSVSVSNFPATQPVSGSVSVSNFPATQAVTGTFWQATQPVSGTVDVGNFPATQAVSGSVSVSNFPATQAVTGTFWQTTQPVSGSVSVGNFPATQTVDGSVTVSGTVDVGNFPASTTVAGTVDVGNFPATQTVDGSVTVSGTVDVGNFPTTQAVTGTFFQTTQPVSGTVDVGNFPASTTVDGTVDVGNFPATQTVDGSVSVSNFPATQAVTGTFFQATQPVSGSVSVSNFPATQAVTGTFWQTTQPISGTVTANQGTSPWIVSSTGGSTNVASFPPTSTDAFGRLRVSQPYTMFDSQHRYADNNLWATSAANGGAAVFNAAQGLMDLNVTAAAGSQVLRETVRTFAYQPGKSLQVMTTFVMSPPKVGLSQRIGYYNVGNGFFVELNDNLASLCFVERSSVTGSVTNTKISQLGGVYGAGDTGWNVDPMDGTGPSGITLDITKAQILWMDLEWLGVGTVRMGFVINGQFYVCHAWDHANLITSTYITTASLPMRHEIVNNTATSGPSTFKQICATVISEGGYILTGSQQSIGSPITVPRAFAVAGVNYPVVSLRLKPTRLDAICILSAISIMGNGNNERFQWSLQQADAVIGGSWLTTSAESAVEYNLSGTSTSGGRTLASGYVSSSNQGSPSVNIFKEDLFVFQLERNPFTLTPYTLTLTMSGANNTTSAYASLDWEEVCR